MLGGEILDLASFLNLFIKSVKHSNLTLFTSWSIWDHRHEGVSISIRIMVSIPYTMGNRVSLGVCPGVVWLTTIYHRDIFP